MTNSSSMKILLIGSNPSQKAGNCDTAFTLDTTSGRILKSWIEGIDGTFFYENIISQKTENNRPLKKYEMDRASVPLKEKIDLINPDRIVALGKSAAYVLSLLKLKYLEMPHPSGLNRKLNDKAYTESKLTELRLWCQ